MAAPGEQRVAPGALQRAERGSVGALGLALTPPLRALQDLGRFSPLPRGERLRGGGGLVSGALSAFQTQSQRPGGWAAPCPPQSP